MPCSNSVDPCASYPCPNGQSCYMGPSGYPICSQGPSSVNYACNSNPCGNGGSCFPDMYGSYHCMCFSGHSGVNCEIQSQGKFSGKLLHSVAHPGGGGKRVMPPTCKNSLQKAGHWVWQLIFHVSWSPSLKFLDPLLVLLIKEPSTSLRLGTIQTKDRGLCPRYLVRMVQTQRQVDSSYSNMANIDLDLNFPYFLYFK